MQLELSQSDIKTLRKLQRNLTGSSDYARVTCILMLYMGNSPSFISECLGIDSSTVYRYRGAFLSGGVGELLENRHKGYWGMLDSGQLSALCRELKSRIYTDAKSVRKWIFDTFCVRYTVQGVVDLLNRIGFTYKKTTEVPCEADASKQEEFMEELSALLKEKEETDVVYYADGVHPTHNSRSTYGWIEKGEEFPQPTVSGRERVNINGLLNAHDVTDVIAHDCVSVNAQSTKALYQAALEKHPEASTIYIISDNAKYYRNKELQQWVKGTKIVPIFLPPYSPNLNLIERLWKFLRKKVINTGFFRTKGEFRKAVLNFFDNIGKYKEELESLLTLNFRLANSQTISV
jgi:transposase